MDVLEVQLICVRGIVPHLFEVLSPVSIFSVFCIWNVFFCYLPWFVDRGFVLSCLLEGWKLEEACYHFYRQSVTVRVFHKVYSTSKALVGKV
jgi:hypothetical protein